LYQARRPAPLNHPSLPVVPTTPPSYAGGSPSVVSKLYPWRRDLALEAELFPDEADEAQGCEAYHGSHGSEDVSTRASSSVSREAVASSEALGPNPLSRKSSRVSFVDDAQDLEKQSPASAGNPESPVTTFVAEVHDPKAQAIARDRRATRKQNAIIAAVIISLAVSAGGILLIFSEAF
jgi:hypothetical protein